MSPALLAIVSAALYGSADFVGGVASRRASALSVVFVSQFTGGLALALLLPVMPAAVVTAADVGWGAVAGLGGGVGVALLYRALAIGTMSVVAPTTAVCGVAIPVAVSMLGGERPLPLALAGMAIALVAIVLVSQAPPAPPPASGGAPAPGTPGGAAFPALPVLLAVASGIAIGVFYLALARTGRAAGMWPLLAARGASAAFFAIIVWSAGRGGLGVPRHVLPLVLGGGLADMLANALYLLATRRGALSMVVTLASLYPVSTVLLARLILHERLSPPQIVGIAACLAAIVMIVVGTA